MHEILRSLAPGSRILDLGARGGSFQREVCPSGVVVRLDIERSRQTRQGDVFVQGDAARLPFRDHCFDVVIANHSLEHMVDLNRVLAEIGRVVGSAASLYVAVPDSTTLSDRLYRWVYHGGGHVNPFRSVAEIDAQINRHISLAPAGFRTLHSSFGFLEKTNFRPRPPRRMWLFWNGNYAAIALLSYVSRVLDGFLNTRFSVYGWAIYYGRTDGEVDGGTWSNVCLRCGSAHPANTLRPRGLRRALMYYNCPACGAWNLFTPDPLRQARDTV